MVWSQHQKYWNGMYFHGMINKNKKEKKMNEWKTYI